MTPDGLKALHCCLLVIGVIPTVTTDLGYIGNRVTNSSTFAWMFTPCGQNGAQGPTQVQCNSAYRHKKISVRVTGDTSPTDKIKLPRGTQVWTIPSTGTYGVTAIGASGGYGVKNNDRSNTGGFDMSFGSSVYAKFHFQKGEEVFMVIGQMGESACAKPNHRGVSEKVQNMCELGISDANDAHFFNNRSGGGGGGGGGTYVFKLDETGRPVPLIIASGGGGRSYRARMNRHRPKAVEKQVMRRCQTIRQTRYQGLTAKTDYRGPGGGGGWNDTRPFKHTGQSLLEGAEGGDSCRRALEGLGWRISGGFGGGGGACSAGGGGGGYIGGEVAQHDDYESDGWFGVNFIASQGEVDTEMTMDESCGINDKDGDVTFERFCHCEQFCKLKNADIVCDCRQGFSLDKDGIHCIPTAVVINKQGSQGELGGTSPPSYLPEPVEKSKPPVSRRTETAPEDDLSTTALIGIIVGAIVATMFVTFFFVLFLRKQKHKRQMAMRLEVLTGFTAPADSQLERLRQTNAITEHNPHYDVCGAKCSLDDLMQTPRENLTLVSALGQGAFGEVYKGYLVNLTPDKPGELPVAVKTLPAMSTEQSEMDFLMEALIMSKFDHPYIVKFIGVCFEKHPRYLILELLAGGDLKSFLRDNRPKPCSSSFQFQPSPLSMKDLLQCAIDIAKGCHYLEMNHFIHRDIAARNCLLTSKGPDRVVKIADFGMARDVYRADYYRKGGKAMLPVKWMPPEAFMDGIFTSKTDTWSFGILLWEVFSLGYMPYPGRGNQEVMQFVAAGGRLDPPTNCPTPVYRIMTQCWHAMYERRPNFTSILERLDYCMQDPDVIDARLPTFSRRPSLENDFTIMRPKFTDPALSIGSAKKYSHMDSDIEDSTEHLLQDDLLENKKHANMFASAESLDKLLTDDNAKDDHDSETEDGASMYSTDMSTPNTPGPVLKASSNQSRESLSDKLDDLDELASSNRSLSIPVENGYVENGCLLSNSPAVMENSNPEEVILNGFGHHNDEEDAIIDELTNGNDLDNDPLITRQRPGLRNPVEKRSSLPLDRPMNGDHDAVEKVRRTSQTSQNSLNNHANMDRVNNYYVKSMDRPTTRLPNGTDQSEWKTKNGGPLRNGALSRQFESSIV
ncbi:ALK tyrosine kinase receptor-like isoform X3 [Lineus longissimus]|uniref:ALK tyrosine kinase receptor-like isoform X3 n=1 Tax=Lineus longissimus TaxID=88925 RepID=UPI00315D6900